METKQRIPSYLLPFHTCELCGYRTKSIPLIESHVRRCNEMSESYFNCEFNNLEQLECHICDFENDLKLAVDRHKTLVHGDIDDLLPQVDIRCYKCNKCGFETHSVLALARHVCRNTDLEVGIRPFEKHAVERLNKNMSFECQHCTYKSVRKYHLNRHILMKHTRLEDIKWWDCSNCSYRAKEKDSLNKHISRRHPKLKRYSLMKHTSTKPKKIRWFDCKNCSYKTKQKGDMKRHMLMNHETLEEIKTKQKRNVKSHMFAKRASAGKIKWFECDHCYYKAKQKSNLRYHILAKHAKPEDTKWFECDYCSHKTKWQHALKKHILVIHGKSKGKSR